MPKHILITYEGKNWTPIQSVFKEVTVKTLGVKTKLPADTIVWFKAHMEYPFAKQIDTLIENYHPQRFVVMSNQPNTKEAVYAMAKGARAYVNAHAGQATIQQIFDVIKAGNVWLGQSMMQSFVKIVNEKKPEPKKTSWQKGLTKREIQVAECLKQGLNNKLIARKLGITERTVKAHISSIFQKKRVSDRLHLALKLSK